MKTAKLGALFVVFVMAFTAVAASYAHWEETLTISGVMTTDDIDPYFYCIDSNDKPKDDMIMADPDECGTWSPDHVWGGLRRDKDVGSCDIDYAYYENNMANNNKLEIIIKDAYPCYYAHPMFCIGNKGSVPVLIHGLKLTELSIKLPTMSETKKIPVDIDLAGSNLDTWNFVDIYQNAADEWKAKVKQGPVNNPGKYDFSLKLTGDLDIDTQLDPMAWLGTTSHVASPVTTLNGDLCIHFENGCLENTIYDFTIELVFYNWPHYVGNPPW